MGGSVFMSTTPTRFVRQRSNARYAGTCANSFVRARSRRWRDESSNCLFFVRHVIIGLIFIKYVTERAACACEPRRRFAPCQNVLLKMFWHMVGIWLVLEMLLLLLPSSCPFLPPPLGKTYRLFPLLVFRVNPKK